MWSSDDGVQQIETKLMSFRRDVVVRVLICLNTCKKQRKGSSTRRARAYREKNESREIVGG